MIPSLQIISKQIRVETVAISAKWSSTAASDLKYISGFDPALEIKILQELKRALRKERITNIFR